jgi:hypothetical protein
MRATGNGGQASLVVLAFLATLVGGFLVLFSVGQTVNDKVRLVNAADAAAFSAAQWQARSLNYQAYLNRAIVANEVAIAQMVSLRSWSKYVGQTISNAKTVSTFFPPIRAALQVLDRIWSQVDNVISNLDEVEGMLSHWNVDVLANAQAIAHQQAPIVAAQLVEQVVQLQEPRAEVYQATRLLQARNGVQWQRFTTTYQRGGGDLRRYTQLLMNSRDGFTARRSADLLPSSFTTNIPKRGGTDLLGEYSWRGVDSLALHVGLWFGSVEIPVGWGAAEQRSRRVSQQGEHGGSLRTNPETSQLALDALEASENYQGVPEIRDVVQPNRQDDRRIGYSVALRIARSKIDTADRLLIPEGLAGVSGDAESFAPLFAADALHALGSAEVYFQRPQERSDGRREYPSLFSPYWQARLSTLPGTDRQIVASQRGLQFDPFGLVP